ncbi:PadR family transcriptional regulator [Candidatus Dojkabacteria bacterium]|nr:PadR family transcriptional regulator [Candidatus Dojkabacteria bacterium]
MSIRTQLKKGTLELCILALIYKEKRYGYDLVCLLRDAGLLVAEGTLYPILTRLGKEGLVIHAWVESTQGPPRKYYEITNKGREILKEELIEWGDISKSVDKLINGIKF